MKIGLCTVTFRDLDYQEILALAEESKLQAIEWGADKHLPVGEIDLAQEIKAKQEAIGVNYTSYGSYYFLQDSSNFQAVLETAQALGAATIRIWAGKKASAEADSTYREALVREAQLLADKAKAVGINLGIEYHSGTLTDTVKSALDLIQAIDKENVYLYWQPAESLSHQERLDSLKDLLPYISNVHVFHWEDFNNRFALARGKDQWTDYLEILNASDRTYYFEFVKNDSPDQFKEDLATLVDIKEEIS